MSDRYLLRNGAVVEKVEGQGIFLGRDKYHLGNGWYRAVTIPSDVGSQYVVDAEGYMCLQVNESTNPLHHTGSLADGPGWDVVGKIGDDGKAKEPSPNVAPPYSKAGTLTERIRSEVAKIEEHRAKRRKEDEAT